MIENVRTGHFYREGWLGMGGHILLIWERVCT